VEFQKTGTGYRMECRLPWASLALKPGAGSVAGFEVGLTDVDGGTVHAQMAWAGADHAPGDPRGFGYLILGE